jgi:hypothetical protein
MKVAAWLLALVTLPLLARVGSSFFLTYKYEHFVRAHLSPTTAAADTDLTRAAIDRAFYPLKSEAVSGELPLIFMGEKDRARAYVRRYYLARSWLAGCYLYMAFDGPGESSKFIGHRDTCE